MKLSEYKAQTLARADVKDIVKLEAVDRDRSGNVIVLRTENGRDAIKYDVHLMREIDGITKFDKEMIVVLDKDKETEEVHYREQGSSAPVAATESQIETYVKSLPFILPRITEMNTEVPWVKFEAIQVTGANAGKEVKVVAYRDGSKPTYLILE
jgi:hypothetical protein